MKYHYFVSYFFKTATEDGYNECEVFRESPIFDHDELEDVSNSIKSSYSYESVVVLNWRRFEQAE